MATSDADELVGLQLREKATVLRFADLLSADRFVCTLFGDVLVSSALLARRALIWTHFSIAIYPEL